MYKCLIYISEAYGFPIGEPLFDCIKDNGYQVKWFVDRKETYEKSPFKEDTFKNIQEVVTYNPDIIFAATNVVPDFLKGLKVQIFHGFNAEKRDFRKGHFRIRGFFDLYCTQGPSTTIFFKELQKQYQTFDVIETGWPKVDPMFPVLRNEVSNKKNIIISTTFTERLSLAYREDIFNKIKELRDSGKYHFKMSVHPMMPKNIIDKWKHLNNENFELLETTYLIPYLKEANVMIADTTSVIQEFLLLKRPVITINHNMPKPYLINITSVDELEAKIDYAFSNPKELIEKIDTFVMQLHPYFDGKSSQRVLDAAISFLHKGKRYLKKKPWNLVRKWKIRQRLGYFTFKSYNKALTLPKIEK